MFSAAKTLYICARQTEAVLEAYISVQQTQRLCWSLIYLCNKHRGCVGAFYICVIDTEAVLEPYIPV